MPAPKTKIAIVLLLLLAVAKLALLVWSVDKGFEMTDEGYYLLWFHSAHLYAPDMHLNYYYLVQLFFGWVDWDITTMRIGGLATEIGAVLMLGWGVGKYLKARLPQLYSVELMAALLMAGLAILFTAEHPRSLSYDSVTHLLVATGGTMLLAWLAMAEKPRGGKLFIFFALLGFIIGAQFIVKFSSAILLGGVWLLAYMLDKRRNKTALLPASGVLGGIAFTFVAIFLTQLSPATFLEYYRISYERISQLGYSPLDIILKTYLAQDAVHFAVNIGPALLAMLGVTLGLKSQPPNKQVLVALLIGLLLFVGQALVFPTNYFPQWYYRLIDVLLLLVISGVYIAWRFSRFNREVYVLAGILFVLPFVCAIGSAVNMAMSLFSYLPALAMLLLVLWGYISLQTAAPIANSMVRYGTIIASMAVFLQVFIWPSYLPHGMAAPMYEQTIQPVAHDGVKLDAPTAQFVTETESLLKVHGFVPGNYILALYDLPGLVYLLQGYSPQVLWYFGETTRATTQEAVDNTCWHIGDITLPNVFVVKPVNIHPDVAKCLSFSKLNFPASYILAGTVYNTYCKCEMEVWAPRH